MTPNDDEREHGVLVVREGPSANCSSIGSVVDLLFATAVVGGAVFAAVAAAIAREDVTVVGEPGDAGEPAKKGDDDAPST
jgi:hypothetical protein